MIVRSWLSKTLITVGILAVYTTVYFAMGRLDFDPRKDEKHYWPATQKFSDNWPGNLRLLRNYGELNTPLPFIIFGGADRMTNGGIRAGRLVNFAVSLAILLVFVYAGQRRLWERAAACVGLLAFPYFLGCATHLYTDMIPAGLVLVGFMFYMSGSGMLSGLAFVAAISSRQYMIAFPAGLLLVEIICWLRAFNQDRITKDLHASLIWWQLLACLSIIPWVILWGGNFAPATTAGEQAVAGSNLLRFTPENSLYALACLGAYFVIPELVLFAKRRRALWATLSTKLRGGVSMRSQLMLLVALMLASLFFVFPPRGNVHSMQVATMGYLDKFLRLGPDLLRLIVFYILAVAACWRLARMNVIGVLVFANVLLMAKAHIAWDKYMLPMIVVLWFCASMKGATAAPAVEGIGVATVDDETDEGHDGGDD